MKTPSIFRTRRARRRADGFADSVVLLTMAVMLAGSMGALIGVAFA